MSLFLLIFSLWSHSLNPFATQVSYYSRPQETASGEYFTPDMAVCASPSLPMGTQLLLHHKGNLAFVRVIDTGPFAVDSLGYVIYPLSPHPMRRLDLSRSVFVQLFGDTDCGVGSIQILYIKLPRNI